MKFLSSVIAILAAGSASAFAPLSPPVRTSGKAVLAPIKATAAEEYYIDDERRFVMNAIMVTAGLTSVALFGVPYILFFFPPGAGGGGGGTVAKDALGNDLLASEYLSSKPAGDRSLAQGLKGDAT
jgi:cytochrome b6-f complex iron-sulfur subunit